MNQFKSLYKSEDLWTLNYSTNTELITETFTTLQQVKSKCTELGFNLDWTGAQNGNQ